VIVGNDDRESVSNKYDEQRRDGGKDGGRKERIPEEKWDKWTTG
jgi:hypothetical protein